MALRLYKAVRLRRESDLREREEVRTLMIQEGCLWNAEEALFKGKDLKPPRGGLQNDNSYAAVNAQRIAIRFEGGRPMEGLVGKS